MPDFNFQGGEYDVSLIGNKVYELPTDCFPLLDMLTAKEKRKNRRAEAAKMLDRSYHQGMDVLPFYSKTDHQEDLWTSLNKNTVTIAIGPSGVGKTLVALWWGLTEVAKGNLE